MRIVTFNIIYLMKWNKLCKHFHYLLVEDLEQDTVQGMVEEREQGMVQDMVEELEHN